MIRSLKPPDMIERGEKNITLTNIEKIAKPAPAPRSLPTSGIFITLTPQYALSSNHVANALKCVVST